MLAVTRHHLLDHGYPFVMEKPMGVNAEEVRRVAEMAAKDAFVAVPLAQRYHIPPGTRRGCSTPRWARVVRLIDQAYELAGRPYDRAPSTS